MDALQKSLKNTAGEYLCERLYQGKIINRTTCLHCRTQRDRGEDFLDVLLQVLSCPDLAASLRLYTAAELLTGANKYECDTCGCKQEAHRAVILSSLPPILTFSCQRFDINRSTWERVKVRLA